MDRERASNMQVGDHTQCYSRPVCRQAGATHVLEQQVLLVVWVSTLRAFGVTDGDVVGVSRSLPATHHTTATPQLGSIDPWLTCDRCCCCCRCKS